MPVNKFFPPVLYKTRGGIILHSGSQVNKMFTFNYTQSGILGFEFILYMRTYIVFRKINKNQLKQIYFSIYELKRLIFYTVKHQHP